MRKYQIALVIYLMIGLALGLVMEHHLPAMNALGVLYYAITWPLWIIGLGLPIPAFMFTFE